jgi:hypothetical protein
VVRVLLSCCGGTQSNLWIPHIIPILPMQVQGWIWYQAESNVACSVSWKWMPGTKNGIFLEFSLCLSRACLGKMIIFIYKWLKNAVFRRYV